MLTGLLVAGLISGSIIDQQIAAEENRLLALGVDVRAITPEMDAGPEYLRIAREMEPEYEKGWRFRFVDEPATASEKTRVSKILDRLEPVTKKPAAIFYFTKTYGNRGLDFSYEQEIISDWCDKWAEKMARQHEWSLLDRLYQFDEGFRQQRSASDIGVGDNYVTGLTFGRWSSRAEPLLRSWFRMKYEKSYERPLASIWLSQYGRIKRQAFVADVSTSREREQVRKWSSNLTADPDFLKKVDLVLLRNFSRLVSQSLIGRCLAITSYDFWRKLSFALDQEKSLPAQYAMDHLYNHNIQGDFSMFEWNQKLIELDLREARDEGRPMVPTWSKPYCFEPESGSEVTVSGSGNGFNFSYKAKDGRNVASTYSFG